MTVEAPAEGSAAAPGVGRQSVSGSLGRPRQGPKLQGDTRGYMIRRLLVLADVGAFAVGFFLVALYGGFDAGPDRSLLFDLVLLCASAPVWVVLARAHNLYHVDTRRADHGTADEIVPVLQLTTLWSWSVLLLASATGLRPFSLPALVLFWASTFVLLLVFRAVIRAWARRRAWFLQNALVVGTTAESFAIATKILRHPEYRINVVACLELSGGGTQPVGAGVDETESVQSVGPIPLIRGEVDVLEIIGELDVDRILLASSVGSLGEGAGLVSELAELNLHLDVVPGWEEVMGSRLELNEMEGMPLLTLPSTRLSRSSLLLKRVLDALVATCALALFAPLLALSAMAIKLDSPGPVLFRQRRVGKEGTRFELLKLRSMSVDAEELKQGVAHLSIHGAGTETGIFKVSEDPRVTRVGRVLRRFSVDEIPQLFNVLRGDMSLVGPRPLPEDEDSRIEGRFRRRVDLQPGVTGLWQVHGRSNIPFEGMVDLDYLYVTNWSLWSDMKLLIRTVTVVLRGSGAY